MTIDRRTFVQRAALGAAGVTALGCRPEGGRAQAQDQSAPGTSSLPESIRALKPLTPAVVPIANDERRARIEKARRLMAENHLDAIFMEGGTNLYYFTGVRWGNSERTFGVVIPARGEIAYACPGFEEDRARELIKFGTDVRTWQEDESPYRLIANIFRDRGITTGRVGIDERTRFFIVDGIRQEASRIEYAIATPVTAGCRMFKSPAELALMQRANDITITAYKAAWATLREGMPQGELANNITAGFRALGANGNISVQFGKYTAFPHGSITPQTLKQGDVVMIDDGVSVEGYASDITRTCLESRCSDSATSGIWRSGRRTPPSRPPRWGRLVNPWTPPPVRSSPTPGSVRITRCPASPIARDTGSVSTDTNGRISCAATRRRSSPGCASVTNPRSRSTENSAFGWRTVCSSPRADHSFSRSRRSRLTIFSRDFARETRSPDIYDVT